MADPLDDLFGSDDEDVQQATPVQATPLDQQDEAGPAGTPVEPAFYDEEDAQQQPGTSQPQQGTLQATPLEADDEEDLFGRLSDDEDDRRPPAKVVGPPIDVEAPLLPRPSASESVHLLKLTNILGVEPVPFDPATFTKEEEVFIDERGIKRIRLRDANVVRWRTRTQLDGAQTIESNARFVRWSDGSLQLLIGDEVLDVSHQDISRDNVYLHAVCYNIIEGQAHLRDRIALRPASLKSKLHQRLRETVHMTHERKDKVRMHVSGMNPEEDKQRIEKRAEEMERLRMAQDRELNRYNAPPPRYNRPPQPSSRRADRLTTAFLEDDEDMIDEEIRYGDDESEEEGPGARRRQLDEEAEAEAERRLQSAKRAPPPPAAATAKPRRVAADSEEEGSDDGGQQLEEPLRPAPGVRVKRGALIDSDDE